MRSMIRSMSGHGRGEARSEQVLANVELRTVNHRFCRVSMRLPSELAFFEDTARRLIQERIQRGKVDLTLVVTGARSGAVQLDREAAKKWAAQLRELADELGLPANFGVAELLSLPGVVGSDNELDVDPESAGSILEAALRQALDNLEVMRAREGAHMAEDLGARVDRLEAGLERIEAAAADLPGRTRDQLRERVGELLAEVGSSVDESRLIQEAAYFAERADITEETVRLRSHLTKTRSLLGSDQSVGRALDFVAQEIHRELTTIGAKTKELAVAEEVLGLKSELEKIREQVQNVE